MAGLKGKNHSTFSRVVQQTDERTTDERTFSQYFLAKEEIIDKSIIIYIIIHIIIYIIIYIIICFSSIIFKNTKTSVRPSSVRPF